MTKTANLRLGGIAGWGGSQRCEDDTTIRADRSIHQDSPKEPNYLKPTISSRNRAHGSTNSQCYRDAEGSHWHSNATTPRPLRNPQLLSATGSRLRGYASCHGRLPPQLGGNVLTPDAGPHELHSNSAHSQAQQSQNSNIDPPKVEPEGASEGATLNGTTQENTTGISHDDPWVRSELPGITNGTTVNTPQPPAQNTHILDGEPSSGDKQSSKK
ncbi:hypothetical protein PENSUB_11807 [Penicillium subrubescens]|uniref:Uncharacterized protein n=1 Tax=Penicillium subrubescens TaxID=1316194 RepID=A0A1Q5T2R5_9EURO|nr:hypothetical protein PENSUB_11807 [Penicillium subrubescens]